MKNTKLIYVLAILLIAITASSCCSFLATSDKDCNDQRRKLQLVRNISYNKLQVLVNQSDNCDKEGKNMTSVCATEDEKNLLEASRKSNFTIPKQISLILSKGNCDMNDLECCTTPTFCPLDMKCFKRGLVNYRDSIWSKTSPKFWNNEYLNHYNILQDNYPETLLDKDLDDSLDARYLDMSINAMQSYLCMIKNHPILNNAETLRFYYIRYDSKEILSDKATYPYNRGIPTNYHDKHSLAIVPVGGNGTIEYTTDTLTGKSVIMSLDCANNPTANHGALCPPPRNCVKSTLLERVDKNCPPGITCN